MTVSGKRIHEGVGRDISDLARVSNEHTVSHQTLATRRVGQNLLCATEQNERVQCEIEFLTGDM